MKATPHISPAKSAEVSQLSDLIKQSKSIGVVDYKGLKVSQLSELRRLVKKAGGNLVVTKNTLFKIALSQVSQAKLTVSDLAGTSAFVFSLTDEVSALKVLADFAQKNQLPKFKLGILSDQVLSATQVAELSTLPDKPTLISKLLGSLKSPLFSLSYNLNWPISKLVRTLDAVRQAKS